MDPQPQNQAPKPAAAASSDYPVQVSVAYPSSQSRLLALLGIPFLLIRFILLIPQLIALYVLQIAGFVAAWLNMWVVLFTGHSSAGLHGFVAGTLRWSTRVSSYLYGLTDKYPPFRLDP